MRRERREYASYMHARRMGGKSGVVTPAINDDEKIPVLPVSVEVVEEAAILGSTRLDEAAEKIGDLLRMPVAREKSGDDEAAIH